MNREQTETKQQTDVVVRKNVKPLAEVYQHANITGIRSKYKIKEIEIYDVDDKCVPSVTHPFSNTYIDVFFTDEIAPSDAMAFEPKLGRELESIVGAPLSLHGREVTGCKKLIYHVDHAI